MAELHDIDAGLAALLRGDAAAATTIFEVRGGSVDKVRQRIDYHGIGHLLASERAPDIALPGWLSDHLRQAAVACEYWEARHLRAVSPLLAAMQEAGVTPVVMKGTALAYSLYRQPAARMRGDTDLLVDHRHLHSAREALRACGFAKAEELHGKLAQEMWLTCTDSGTDLPHTLDLHWQVNDSPLLQRAVPLQEVLANTRPLDRLLPGVRCLSLADSFIQLVLNAEWHMLFGYLIGDRNVTGVRRLIWTCDVDLLLRAMDEGDWQQLLTRAHDTGVAPALHGAAQAARLQLDTPVAEHLLAELARPPADTRTMQYLRCENRIERAKADFAAAPGLRGKAGFAARMLLPTGRQLRRRYPQARLWPLPALYLRHALENAIKLIRRRPAGG